MIEDKEKENKNNLQKKKKSMIYIYLSIIKETIKERNEGIKANGGMKELYTVYI